MSVCVCVSKRSVDICLQKALLQTHNRDFKGSFIKCFSLPHLGDRLSTRGRRIQQEPGIGLDSQPQDNSAPPQCELSPPTALLNQAVNS